MVREKIIKQKKHVDKGKLTHLNKQWQKTGTSKLWSSPGYMCGPGDEGLNQPGVRLSDSCGSLPNQDIPCMTVILS